MHRSVPIYGMNRGTVGFLLNAYNEDDLPERIDQAARAILHPLAMTAISDSGSEQQARAISEVPPSADSASGEFARRHRRQNSHRPAHLRWGSGGNAGRLHGL